MFDVALLITIEVLQLSVLILLIQKINDGNNNIVNALTNDLRHEIGNMKDAICDSINHLHDDIIELNRRL